MTFEDEDLLQPPSARERGRPQPSRTMLGVLLAVLAIAVLFALWALVFDDDDSTAAGSDGAALPTPITIATSTPEPDPATVVTGGDTSEPTETPEEVPTPIPAGYEACTADQQPSTTISYIVDTNTTPLNQRADPAVGAPLAGTFSPGETGLVFIGECVVNINDNFTWWLIFNGTEDVWIASDFVTPSG